MTSFQLTGNQLKLIAIITMTVDHVGAYMFPDILLLRIIGRLAYPIFAYMIAEGCSFTRNRANYLFHLAFFALMIQSIAWILMDSIYMYILVTFSLSVCLIYLIDWRKARKDALSSTVLILYVLLLIFLCEILPIILKQTDYHIDYGLMGIILPALVYLGRNRREKLILFALGLIVLGCVQNWVQYFALLSIPLILKYNGTRGKQNFKYFFYLYFPLHLLGIELVHKILLAI